MRIDIDAAVARLAGQQYGVFSYAQASASGASESLIERRRRSGMWERPAPAVFGIPGYPESWERDLMIAVLDAGVDAVVSHRAAARLWALDGVTARRVEITVPRARRRFRAAVAHETAPFAEHEVTVVRSIPVTSPAMTLLQLGAVVPEAIVERAYESARRLGLVEHDDVMRVLECRRAGVQTLRRVLVRRDRDAASTDSELETRFLQLIRRHDLPEPVGQHVVHGYRVDFAWPPRRLAVELDGLAFHDGRVQQLADRSRQNVIVGAGWRVLRFTWDDVTRRPEAVVASIRRTLAA